MNFCWHNKEGTWSQCSVDIKQLFAISYVWTFYPVSLKSYIPDIRDPSGSYFNRCICVVFSWPFKFVSSSEQGSYYTCKVILICLESLSTPVIETIMERTISPSSSQKAHVNNMSGCCWLIYCKMRKDLSKNIGEAIWRRCIHCARNNLPHTLSLWSTCIWGNCFQYQSEKGISTRWNPLSFCCTVPDTLWWRRKNIFKYLCTPYSYVEKKFLVLNFSQKNILSRW